MASLAVAARRLTPSPFPCRPAALAASRRALGDGVRGPPITDIAANLKYAHEFFTKKAITYTEYKQQCISLRLFAFGGVAAGCALALALDPPKSSYWMRYSPAFWFSHLRTFLFGGAPAVFLQEPVPRALNVASVVDGLVHKGVLEVPKVPKVVFVLGGPGAGKGTQCGKIVDNFQDWAHISAGDCLREERSDPSSKVGELINNYIKDGKIVPVEITVGLLQKKMAAGSAEGKSCFLIDGFPRNLDNVTGWERVVGASADVCGVLFYEASEEQLEKRLLARGATSGRVDDNIESIKKRFRTYMNESMPIVEKYKEKGMVTAIDGMPPVEEVWKVTEAQIKTYAAMP